MCLLRVVGDDGDERIAELLELQLCLGIEEREGCQVDGGRGILRINNDSICGSGSFAIADSDISKEVLSVSQVGLLFRASEAFSFRRLVFAALIGILLCSLSLMFGDPFRDPLTLGLLGSLLCLRGLRGLRRGCLGLLALNFRIFSGIP